MAAGVYVVIEGNDGTGKSTQVDLLDQTLRGKGIETFVMHEPAGTPISDAIRTVIKNGTLERDAKTNLLLFTAARHENWSQASRALDRGAWVISARNFLSTEVYQGIAEGLDANLIHNLTRQFTDERYMRPDFTFVLTLNDDSARERRISARATPMEPDTFESRGEAFQEKLNQGYTQLAREYGFPVIDATAPIEEVQRQIWDTIFRDVEQSTNLMQR